MNPVSAREHKERYGQGFSLDREVSRILNRVNTVVIGLGENPNLGFVQQQRS